MNKVNPCQHQNVQAVETAAVRNEAVLEGCSTLTATEHDSL